MTTKKTFGPYMSALIAAFRSTKEKMSLKVIRRMANKSCWQEMRRYAPQNQATATVRAAMEMVGEEYIYIPSAKEIDRLISLLGPSWPISMMHENEYKEEGEERKKGTDEVSEVSETPSEDSELHGGDGNSGEVDAPAETSSSEERFFIFDSEKTELENFYNFLDYVENEMEKNDEVSLEDALAPEEETKEKNSVKTNVAKKDKGTISASLEGLKKQGKSSDPQDIKEIKHQLFKMFDVFNDIAGGEQSPRISGKKLIIELVSQRYNLTKARREELRPGVKLLMVDVSGSCSAASQEVLAAAAELAEIDPKILIVVHSNGHPTEVCGGASAEQHLIDVQWGEHNHKSNYRWWLDLIDKFNIIGTVNWGDWDAGFILKKLAEVSPLVWFDSYCSNDGVKPASRWLREGTGGVYSRNGEPSSGWKVQPVSWWQGVNNARTTVIALRQATKEVKKYKG